MSRTDALRWLGFALLAGVAAWVVLTRLSLSYDLAYFLPRPVTEAQQVLIDRVGQGPGSRMLFVVLPGASADQVDAAAARLAALDGVRSVLPREFDPGIESIPAPVFDNRYLLVDVDTSVAGLRRALQARRGDMAMIDDPGFLRLIAADPYLASVSVLDRVASEASAADYHLSARAPFLLLQTRPPAFDLAAQQALVRQVLAAVRSVAPAAEPALYGAGAYGIRLQQAVSREATYFSIAAALVLAVLLWVAYRRLRAVLLAAVPLAAGGLAGLAALALIFPTVHGITLAFGFTLMGVTVDYGLHVLSHARRSGAAGLSGIWPTLMLSAASTALAFLAFTFSGSPGMVQLGVFSAVGIAAAAFFAWLLLPRMADAMAVGSRVPHMGSAAVSLAVQPVAVRFWPLAVCLAAGAGLLAGDRAVWNDDLSTLTPVPAETLAVDRRLRQQTGAPDIRYLAVSRAGGRAAVLARVRDLETTLAAAAHDGVLQGWQAVTALVPDPDTQRQRRAALVPLGLEQRVQEAATGLGFRAAALAPFVADVRRTAFAGGVVTPDSYAGTALAEVVDGMLYADQRGWVALTFLRGLDHPQVLARRLGSASGTTLVDLRSASRSLLATYRVRLLEILAGALAAVTVVLALALRSWRRLAWVTGTLLGSVTLTVAVAARLLGSLSLFDLVAAALVAGLGLDYALFFSRPMPAGADAAGEDAAGEDAAGEDAAGEDARDTLHAVTACFVSTAVVFGLLAASSIPVLHGIGVTVAVGVTAAYLLALGGRYRVNRGRPPVPAAAAPGRPPPGAADR